MVSFLGFIFIYVVGGITFLPLVALSLFIYVKGNITPLLPKSKQQHSADSESYVYKDPDNVIIKKGWIRLTNQYQPKMPEVNGSNNNNGNGGIISGIHSYVSKDSSNNGQKKGVVYAVLKHGTLFCYESEKQQEVVMILPMQDFLVSLYPPKEKDAPEGSIYGRTVVVRLVPNSMSTVNDDINLMTFLNKPSVCTLSEEDITCYPSRILYLTCARNIDKEDWYLGLVEAHHMLQQDQSPEEAQYVMMDNTHFDPSAMEELIRQVQSSPSHRETAWINAVFGRLFLGMYKTYRLKDFVENKIRKKIDKTKRPTFLDEISVRKVDVGGSVPFITDPKLLSLSPEGEVVVEAKVEYHGGLAMEIETDFNWSYSSHMKPIRMHLILSVKLRQLAGRMMFKLKAPPTNRYWLAFFEMPEMDWKITPVVADKQIKLSIVTNAIESRIREVMAETFVLPNMDDTSFCPSGGKGGIFGEYIKVKRRTSKESAYVNDDDEKDMKHSRENSTSSDKSNKSTIRESPSVPDSNEKPSAADILKLKNRRAESANEFALTGAGNNNNEGHQKLEVSHSTPDMQFTPLATIPSGSDNDDASSIKSTNDQKSIAESTVTTGSSSSKWSTGTYLRKRMKKGADDDRSDTESIASTKSNSTSGSGFLNKISSLLPTDSLPTSDSLSVRSNTQNSTSSNGSANNSNKRHTFIHMAENFLAKKTGHDHPKKEPLTENKKELYAERLANMRKRAEEKRLSSSSIGITPPPLPPLPKPINKKLHPVSSPTKSIPDEEGTPDADNSSQSLPPPIKPRRGRAASAAHNVSSSSLQQDHTQQRSLPPRRNSTPIPVSDELKKTKVEDNSALPVQEDGQQEKHSAVPIITEEEPQVKLDTINVDQPPANPKPADQPPQPSLQAPVAKDNRPPLPTTPRPRINETKPPSPNAPRPAPPTYQDEVVVLHHHEQQVPELPPRDHHKSNSPPAVPPRHP